MTRIAMTLGAILMMAGCGGTSTFSCDVSKSSGKSCIFYDAVSGDTTASKNSCMSSGGTVGSSCSMTGVVGSCAVTAPAGESGTVTSYFYDQLPANSAQNCAGIGGTFTQK